MKNYESLSHRKWDCKYDIVFIRKYRPSVASALAARRGQVQYRD